MVFRGHNKIVLVNSKEKEDICGQFYMWHFAGLFLEKLFSCSYACIVVSSILSQMPQSTICHLFYDSELRE